MDFWSTYILEIINEFAVDTLTGDNQFAADIFSLHSISLLEINPFTVDKFIHFGKFQSKYPLEIKRLQSIDVLVYISCF